MQINLAGQNLHKVNQSIHLLRTNKEKNINIYLLYNNGLLLYSHSTEKKNMLRFFFSFFVGAHL